MQLQIQTITCASLNELPTPSQIHAMPRGVKVNTFGELLLQMIDVFCFQCEYFALIVIKK
jgi:hypothetical protein